MADETAGGTPAITHDVRRAAFKAGREAWKHMYPGIGEDRVVDLIIGNVLDTVAAAALAGDAVLDGHAVVKLPRPDAVDTEGDPLWWVGDVKYGAAVIAYCDANGDPCLRVADGEDESADEVESYAAVLLSGVRESRRLAAEFAEGGEPRG